MPKKRKPEPEWTNPLPLMPRKEPLTKYSKSEYIAAQERAHREVPKEIFDLETRDAYLLPDEVFASHVNGMEKYEHFTIYSKPSYSYFYRKGVLEAWINPLGEQWAYA